ncbi:MAG: NADH:flavin oxidoreductase [Desulfobulbus sp.]|nr:NADH:flavin oxidoreductase [Desulfobulbus sp.]
MPDIFSPIQVKNTNFANRIVMAPMVRFGFPCNEGVMGEKLLQDYLGRADKGIGLMISQALSVSPERPIPGGAGAYAEKHISNLNRIAEACHTSGTKFIAQLSLAGFSFYDVHAEDVNKLSKNDLVTIRNEYIHAAENCMKAGLDGVELHGAHTFFLNEMASSYANNRQDEYGGNLTERLFLAREIIEGIRGIAGESFLISYRMGWGEDLDTDVKTAQELERAGVDLLHVSTGIPQDRKLRLVEGFEHHDAVYTACYIKKHVSIPIIAVNAIRTLDRGNALIEQNCCDFAAYGKPFLADSSFVLHSKGNSGFKPCFECPVCQWFTDSTKCPSQVKIRTHANPLN